MTLEEYIINRLTECEAENEELRAVNKMLSDKLARLTGEGTLVLKPESGVYFWPSDGRVWNVNYDFRLAVDGDTYVMSVGNSPDITRIDNERYFLDREAAEAKAREQADQS